MKVISSVIKMTINTQVAVDDSYIEKNKSTTDEHLNTVITLYKGIQKYQKICVLREFD